MARQGYISEFMNGGRILSHGGTNKADARLRRLLHHIAEVSGQDELAAAVHDIALDLESLTADGSPGKAGHKTDRIGLRQLIRQDAARAEEALQIRARHGHAARGLV